MGHSVPRVGYQLAQPRHRVLDRPDPVVDVEDLSLPQQFPADRRRRDPWIFRPHIGEDRVAVLGRGQDVADLPDTGEGHLQRPGDRRGGEGQDIHPHLHGLDAVLGLDPETMLLVHHEQTQLVEYDPVCEQPVRADDHIHLAGPEAGNHPAGLGRSEEPAEHLHPHREGIEPLQEGLEVLLNQQGGRAQHRHLEPVGHGLEGSPQRHLRLSEPDIAEHEPVHRGGGLHVLLDIMDSPYLVAGLLVGKGVLELPLPGGVRREGVSLCGGSGPVDRYHVVGEDGGFPAYPVAGRRPVAAAHPAHPGRLPTCVLAHRGQLVGGNV